MFKGTENVTIVGLGLIGGSVAKALKARSDCKIHAITRGGETMLQCLQSGLFERVSDGSDSESILALSDIVIVCLSPNATKNWIINNAKNISGGAVVTDVCGIKRDLCNDLTEYCSANNLRFVGGHPMAGREVSGFTNSLETLFDRCNYIITPAQNTDSDALETVKSLARVLGAKHITITTPENHDRMIAFTSQLPHVLAGAYMKSSTAPEHKGYSAGSYRDVSRVAPVDEKLWSELFLLNSDNLIDEIDALLYNIAEMKSAILSKDKPQVEKVLREGRIRKQEIDN